MSTGSSFLSAKELRELRSFAEEARGGTAKSSAIVSKRELEDIRGATKIRTTQERKEDREAADFNRTQQRKVARQRRDHIQELDRDRPAMRQAGTADDAGIQRDSKTQALLDEQEDDVKQMNNMMLFSKVLSVRDKQVDENQKLEKEWVREQSYMANMMEIERLKDLRAQEEREHKRRIAAREGALRIIDQIKHREEERLRQQDILDKEKQHLLLNIEEAKKQDEELRQEKAARIKKLSVEIEASNKEAIRLKAVRREEEKKLEMEIFEYQRKKDEAEEAKALEARRLADERELETQKLRELQERASDRQAEIDEKRALRAQEEEQKLARQKAKLEREKRERVRLDLEEARVKQFQHKEEMMTKYAKDERDNFLRVVEKQRTDEEAERYLEEQKKAAFLRYKGQLREQITQNGEVRRQEKQDYEAEGHRLRKRIDGDRSRIKSIQGHKVRQLGDLQIAGKYVVDLKQRKIGF